MNTLLLKISKILDEYIVPKKSLILGVSGGPDSTALLHLLNYYCKQKKCRIVVGHVNHGIRGSEADKDQKFVQNLCKTLKVEYFAKKIKIKGSGLEEKGRIERRKFFEYLRNKENAKWIITAHTEDDNLETVFLNFLRGSGIKGLAGMKIRNGGYLKPLLTSSKKEILAYLKSNRLKFRVDKTNYETRFKRNLIRKKILPLANKVNASLKKTLLRNAEIFNEIDVLLNIQAKRFLREQSEKTKKAGSVYIKEYLKLPKATQNYVLKIMYQQYAKSHYGLPFVKIAEISDLINKNVGNKKIYVGKSIFFYLNKGVVSIRKH